MSKRKIYDRIARLYDVLDLPFEHGRYKPLRRVLFGELNGALLDVGVGKSISKRELNGLVKDSLRHGQMSLAGHLSPSTGIARHARCCEGLSDASPETCPTPGKRARG